MKQALHAIVLATLCVPIFSFAQTNQAPLTRAEVHAQLVQIERAGYNPARKDAYYPADIQAAEARIQTQSISSQNATSGYGSMPAARTEFGHSVSQSNWMKDVYDHH